MTPDPKIQIFLFRIGILSPFKTSRQLLFFLCLLFHDSIIILNIFLISERFTFIRASFLRVIFAVFFGPSCRSRITFEFFFDFYIIILVVKGLRFFTCWRIAVIRRCHFVKIENSCKTFLVLPSAPRLWTWMNSLRFPVWHHRPTRSQSPKSPVVDHEWAP